MQPPEGQPASTKELSQGVKWANLHVMLFDPKEYFQCVQQRANSAELFGTFLAAGAVFLFVALTRWLANDFVMPWLACLHGHEVPEEGFFMFPSWEILAFDAVSMHLCWYTCVCV